ncbi:MAG: hypothetical protein Q9191_002918 [Dirinaria sp. TL-2023a]
MTGSVSPLYEPAVRLTQAGVVPGYDLTSEAALTKLSFLLGLPDLAIDDVTQQMSKSLRGEITEQAPIAFEHPSIYLSKRVTSLTALGYAIACGSVEEVKDLLEGDIEWMLNESDYAGNTPLHIASTGASLEILRILLLKGASVHIRNKGGRTPLFVAANAGLHEHVVLLRQSGAHFHADELETAKMQSGDRHAATWHLAGA